MSAFRVAGRRNARWISKPEFEPIQITLIDRKSVRRLPLDVLFRREHEKIDRRSGFPKRGIGFHGVKIFVVRRLHQDRDGDR